MTVGRRRDARRRPSLPRGLPASACGAALSAAAEAVRRIGRRGRLSAAAAGPIRRTPPRPAAPGKASERQCASRPKRQTSRRTTPAAVAGASITGQAAWQRPSPPIAKAARARAKPRHRSRRQAPAGRRGSRTAAHPRPRCVRWPRRTQPQISPPATTLAIAMPGHRRCICRHLLPDPVEPSEAENAAAVRMRARSALPIRPDAPIRAAVEQAAKSRDT